VSRPLALDEALLPEVQLLCTGFRPESRHHSVESRAQTPQILFIKIYDVPNALELSRMFFPPQGFA
jgi:hypothetical protein